MPEGGSNFKGGVNKYTKQLCTCKNEGPVKMLPILIYKFNMYILSGQTFLLEYLFCLFDLHFLFQCL